MVGSQFSASAKSATSRPCPWPRSTAPSTAASGRCATSARRRGARRMRPRPTARCARAAGSRPTRRRAAALSAKDSSNTSRAPTGCAPTAWARRASRPSARRGARSSRSCAPTRTSRRAPPRRRTPPLARATVCSTRMTITSRTCACGAAISGRARAPCAGASTRRSLPPARPTRTASPTAAAPGAPSRACTGPRLTSRALRRGPGTCSRSSASSMDFPSPSGRGRAAAWAVCVGSSRRTRPSRCTCARRT